MCVHVFIMNMNMYGVHIYFLISLLFDIYSDHVILFFSNTKVY